MVSINTDYQNKYVNGSTNVDNSNVEKTNENLFSVAVSTGTTVDTSALETKLAAYQAQKEQLEAELAQYNQEKSQLTAKNTALETQATNINSEIEELEANREAYEEEAKALKESYEKSNITLLSLIKKMNEKINETNETCAQAAQEQEQKTEEATNEAFEKYEAGEITEDEIPNYIAQKTGNKNLIDQVATAGLSAVESFSSQVKGLIAQMAQTLNYLNDKKVDIESVTDKITNKKSQLTIIQNEKTVVDEDIAAVDAKINTTTQKIATVDKNIAEIEAQLANEEETQEETTANANQNNSNPFANGNNGFTFDFGSDAEFVSVTSTIDFRGFKATLDMMMTQNNQSVKNLRDQINEQKQIALQA